MRARKMKAFNFAAKMPEARVRLRVGSDESTPPSLPNVWGKRYPRATSLFPPGPDSCHYSYLGNFGVVWGRKLRHIPWS